MAKNIVFCADGTWNGPEEENGKSVVDGNDNAGEFGGNTVTNVVKFYSNLAGRPTPETIMLHDEQEKLLTDGGGEILQVAKYLHGVGDSRNPVMKVMGGVFGMGVIARIVRGYTFISRYYQPGDAIHILGFSRGAYTARALAGMIGRVGLLNPTRYGPNDKEESYRRGAAAWHRSKSLTLNGNSAAVKLANRFLDFVESFVARDALTDADFISEVPVTSVGVWDTVGSMGLPIYLRDTRYDVFRYADYELSKWVKFGFHAMAIDEFRADFPVTPWESRDGIEQVWFTGAHADVGGGYDEAESRLSDVALEWMMRKLDGAGVRFATPLTRVPNCQADTQKIHMPWKNPPFHILPKAARQPSNKDVFHISVVERWKRDPQYRPHALPFITPQNVDALKVQR